MKALREQREVNVKGNGGEMEGEIEKKAFVMVTRLSAGAQVSVVNFKHTIKGKQ